MRILTEEEIQRVAREAYGYRASLAGSSGFTEEQLSDHGFALAVALPALIEEVKSFRQHAESEGGN